MTRRPVPDRMEALGASKCVIRCLSQLQQMLDDSDEFVEVSYPVLQTRVRDPG